jgi:hypothetical protein
VDDRRTPSTIIQIRRTAYQLLVQGKTPRINHTEERKIYYLEIKAILLFLNTPPKTGGESRSNTDTAKHRGWIQEQYGHCQTPGVNTGAWKGKQFLSKNK